jgi:hypothetical protein
VGGLTQSLRLSINGNSAGAVSALRQLNRGLTGAGQTGSRFGHMLRMGALLAAAAFGVLMIGVYAVWRALKSIVGAASTWMGGLLKLHRLTGMTTPQVALLAGQFRLSGVEATAAATGIGFFEKNLGAAHLGMKAKIVTFQQLGVTLKDVNGRWLSSADVLQQVRDRLSAMTDSAKRSYLATALFGRGGRELLPWLLKSQSAMAGYNKQIQQFGMFTGKDMATYQKFIGNQRLMSFWWDMLKVKAGLMAQTLMNRVFPAIQQFWTKHEPAVLNAIKGVFDWLGKHGAKILTTIVGVLSTMEKVLAFIAKHARAIGVAFATWKVSRGVMSLLSGGARVAGAIGARVAGAAGGAGAAAWGSVLTGTTTGAAASGATVGGAAAATMSAAAVAIGTAIGAAMVTTVVSAPFLAGVHTGPNRPGALPVRFGARGAAALPPQPSASVVLRAKLTIDKATLTGQIADINKQIAAVQSQGGGPTAAKAAIIAKLQTDKAQIQQALFQVDQNLKGHKVPSPDTSSMPPAFTKAGQQGAAKFLAVVAGIKPPAIHISADTSAAQTAINKLVKSIPSTVWMHVGAKSSGTAHYDSHNNYIGFWARGGLFTKPTLGVMGDEGPELLLPLSKPRRMAELLRQAGVSRSGAAVSARSGLAGAGDVYVTVEVHSDKADPKQVAIEVAALFQRRGRELARAYV